MKSRASTSPRSPPPSLTSLLVLAVTLKDKKKRIEERQKRREEREHGRSGTETGTYQFPMPVFDDAAFHGREKTTARLSLLAVGIGAVAGIVAALAQPLLTRGDPRFWFLGLVFYLAGAGMIRPASHALGIDTSKMKGKDWLGHIMTILFTFLAAWILSINPPFV